MENVLIDRTRSNAFIIDFGMSLIMPMDNEGRRQDTVFHGYHRAPLSTVMVHRAHAPLLAVARQVQCESDETVAKANHRPFVRVYLYLDNGVWLGWILPSIANQTRLSPPVLVAVCISAWCVNS